jgi:hypothetical protein
MHGDGDAELAVVILAIMAAMRRWTKAELEQELRDASGNDFYRLPDASAFEFADGVSGRARTRVHIGYYFEWINGQEVRKKIYVEELDPDPTYRFPDKRAVRNSFWYSKSDNEQLQMGPGTKHKLAEPFEAFADLDGNARISSNLTKALVRLALLCGDHITHFEDFLAHALRRLGSQFLKDALKIKTAAYRRP